jgi:hypothetical protein
VQTARDNPGVLGTLAAAAKMLLRGPGRLIGLIPKPPLITILLAIPILIGGAWVVSKSGGDSTTAGAEAPTSVQPSAIPELPPEPVDGNPAPVPDRPIIAGTYLFTFDTTNPECANPLLTQRRIRVVEQPFAVILTVDQYQLASNGSLREPDLSFAARLRMEDDNFFGNFMGGGNAGTKATGRWDWSGQFDAVDGQTIVRDGTLEVFASFPPDPPKTCAFTYSARREGP